MNRLEFRRESTHTARKPWRCTFCGMIREAGTRYEKIVEKVEDYEIYQTQACSGRSVMETTCVYWEKFCAVYQGEDWSGDPMVFYNDQRGKDLKDAENRARDYANDAEARFLLILPQGFDRMLMVKTIQSEAPIEWLASTGMTTDDVLVYRDPDKKLPHLFWFKDETVADTFTMFWAGKQVMG